MKLLITAGYHTQERGQSHRYDSGALLIVDWDTKSIIDEFTYVSPQPSPLGQMHFVHGELENDRLLVTTATEVLELEVGTWAIQNSVSHRHFNDLHHVVRHGNFIYVCNTGLQAVHKMTRCGEIIDTYSANRNGVWQQYSPDRDYRTISTKPHAIHPNYLFVLGESLWVTRFHTRDAVALQDHALRMEIGAGNPHDGLVHGNEVFFTTTNGQLVAFDASTRERTRHLDFQAIDRRGCQLAWCRGLCMLDDEHALVGFTSFRTTPHKEFVHWILRDGQMRLPSRLALYNLREKRLLEEMNFSGRQKGMAVYSILRLE